MTKRKYLFVHGCGIATPIGMNTKQVAKNLFSGYSEGLKAKKDLLRDRTVHVGSIDETLPSPPIFLKDLDCRNNRLMQVTLEQISPFVERAISKYGRHRIGVILGTSTSGMSDGEKAFSLHSQTGQWPEAFHYNQQEASSLSAFSARFFGITGPAYTIATACSSSAKVFASARRLINAGVIDAAIVGGADTICNTTLKGFNSLELLTDKKCNPFSANRDGINIGEGAAAFLISKEEGLIELLGVGETSDAFHPTAPDPEGQGAYKSMFSAMTQADLEASDISYINLHGTASILNDAMESKAVAAIFGDKTPCSSTKGMTGHTLGAAGGIEAAFLWLTLNAEMNPGYLPPHLWDNAQDHNLPVLNLVQMNTTLEMNKKAAMLSNSFGFGGSNVSLILGRGHS